MSSAAIAEFVVFVYNCNDALIIRIALIKCGHPQPPTTIQTDNSTDDGIVNATVRYQQYGSMVAIIYRVKDKVT